jgi:uncharacterized zinc-type alcohol dehydrogenase-like protein
MKVHAYAANEAKGQLSKLEYVLKDVGANDIEIKISHCGICHSDIHLVDNALGITKYPFVPGHEIVGTVIKVGASTKRFKAGDRVGVGWQSGSCGVCDFCAVGDENLCAKMESTCVTQYGGYGDSFVVSEHFAVAIPEGMPSEQAAPLMCGGVTVYQPLRYYGIKPNMKTAVVGIGGLGHLAIQFLAAMGCEVTAISSSDSKAKEAATLGAQHFISLAKEPKLDKHTNYFDFIMSTASVDLDWNAFFQALKPKGQLCLIGLNSKEITVPAAPLVFGQRTVCGSWIGSPSMIRETVEFAHRNKINVMTEQMKMDTVNAAIKKVRANEVRYRAVLTN